MTHVERRAATTREAIERVLRQRAVRTTSKGLAHRVDRMATGIREQSAQPVRQSLLGAELQRVIRGRAVRDGPIHVRERGTTYEKNGRAIVDRPVPGTA